MQKLQILKSIVQKLEASQRRHSDSLIPIEHTKHNQVVCKILNDLYQELSELEHRLPDAKVDIDFANYSKIKVRIAPPSSQPKKTAYE